MQSFLQSNGTQKKHSSAALLMLVLVGAGLLTEKVEAKQVQANHNKQESGKKPQRESRQSVKIGPMSDPSDPNLLEQKAYEQAKKALQAEKDKQDVIPPEQQIVPQSVVAEPVRVNTMATFEKVVNVAHSAYYEGDRTLMKLGKLSGKESELAELLFDMFSMAPGKKRIEVYRPKFEKLYPQRPELYKVLGAVLDDIGDHEAAGACAAFSMHK